jgi:hypothetical protein
MCGHPTGLDFYSSQCSFFGSVDASNGRDLAIIKFVLAPCSHAVCMVCMEHQAVATCCCQRRISPNGYYYRVVKKNEVAVTNTDKGANFKIPLALDESISWAGLSSSTQSNSQ